MSYDYKRDIKECTNCKRKYICDVKEFEFCKAECLFDYSKHHSKPIRPYKKDFDSEILTLTKKSNPINDDPIMKLLKGAKKKCAYCGGVFQADESWRRYCTKECYDAGKEDMEIRICQNCKRNFQTDQNWRTFCSKDCYDEFKEKKIY